MANVPAMDFIPRINEIPMREEEMDRLKELPEFLDKFLKALLTIVGFMATTFGVEFSTKHPNLMMVIVFMIVLYFLLWLLGAMLRHRIQSLEKILSWIMLVIGSVSSVLVLTIINPVLACLASLFLLSIFAVVAYHNSEELYQLFVSPVSDTINTLIASYREGGQSAGLPV